MREPGPDRADLRALVRDVNARLSAQLRLRRQLAGLSQAQIGNALGVSYQQWHKYENGINRISAGHLLLAIAELQIDAAELVESCLDGSPTRPESRARPLDMRLLAHLAELNPDQRRALNQFLAMVRQQPLPAFPSEAIAL